jgi:hypothetical protein
MCKRLMPECRAISRAISVRNRINDSVSHLDI